MSEPTTVPNEQDAGADARVEAAAKAGYLFDECTFEDHPMPWEMLCDRYPGTADRWREIEKAALAAADAVGAVGVTVEWLDGQIALVGDQRKNMHNVMRSMAAAGYIEALKDVRALLTNQQPAAPTSDGATGGE